MTRYVPLEAVARLMSAFAPPAWCKLAIHGALHTHRVALYSANGWFRAYIPPYHLKAGPGLPPLIRNTATASEIIDRYGLKEAEIDNTKDTEIWSDKWKDEPRHIAPGWFMFSEPWGWEAPALSYDYFEIPRDYREFFGFDDLHPEGEPDDALYYAGTFGCLCLTFEDAESVAPMCDFDPVAFGSKTQTPTRKIGRPRQSGFESADEPIVKKMLADRKAEPSLSARSLAEKYVHEAVGHGTVESKIKRLERRLWDYGV